MLIQMFRNTYREMTGQLAPAAPVTRISANRPAANAGDFGKAQIQARRHRRQRRMEREMRRAVNGWTVRSW